MPTVRLPATLRKYADGAERCEVDASTAAEAIDAAIERHPGLETRLLRADRSLHPHLIAFVGEERIDPGALGDAPLAPADTLTLLVGVAGGEDVRMRGFRERSTVDEARAAALRAVSPLPAEEVSVGKAAGRVLAEAVVSDVAVPPFRRATMDGYAVRAEGTFGASFYNPVVLAIVGESMPGGAGAPAVGTGRAVRIMTGAAVPDGADAVLQAEDAEEAGDRVEVRAPVPAGRNVGRIGEDVDVGSVVLPAGRRLLPQDLGLLSAVGHDPVGVHRRPRVRIVVSGDELLPPGSRPEGARIVDSNSPMLAALVKRDGGVVERIDRLPDGAEPMREALSRPGAEVIVTAGAASVGREDHTPLLVAELGELLVHGVAMRPSSPTGVGRIGEAPVLLLPGNPVSCLVAYDFFACPVIRTMAGLSQQWPYRTVRLALGRRLVSQIGRTDYARVAVREEVVEPLAVRGASVLSSVTRADGFVVIPAGSEGHAEGSEVEVHLYGGECG